MYVRFTMIALALCILIAPADAQSVSDSNLSVSSYLTGLNAPTQIRFLGANDLFITEKNLGRVIHYSGGVATTALDLNVANDGERGLIGLTLDPNFASNHFVYATYSASNSGDGGGWTENRLSRFTWNGTTLGSEQLLHTFGTSSDGQTASPFHNGGPILFGPDGKLYGVNGDLTRNRAEQNNPGQAGNSAGVGGIFRLNPDGTAPADNPFASNPNADFHMWDAYGVRNSYGLAFDPVTGDLWDTENGVSSYDEINRVTPGFNSGWNQLMGPSSRNPGVLGNLVNLPGSAYSDPEFSFFNVVAPTGLTFLSNSSWGAAYQNGLLTGDYINGNLYLLRLNAARDGFLLSGDLSDLVADSAAERNAIQFGQNFGSLTDMQVGPDGAIYLSSYGSGTIYRISPTAAATPEPSAFLVLLAGGVTLVSMVRSRRRSSKSKETPIRKLLYRG